MPTEDEIKNKAVFSLKDPVRLISLTDGVFAIIMTLLVLEIKIPQQANNETLYHQMIECGYKLFLYAVSFLLAGVYWMSHRMLFSHVKYISSTLAWINIIFLMFCSLIPFGAALLGSYPHDPVALAVYGMLLAALAGWRLLMYVFITSRPHLLNAAIHKKQRKRVIEVMTFAFIMFLVSICITSVLPTAALLIYSFTPPIFVAAITIVNKEPK